MIDRGEHATRFRARADVTGVLVLEPNRQSALRRPIRQLTERRDDPVQASLGRRRPPVREDTDDRRAGLFSDLHGTLRKPGLIGDRVRRSKYVLLKPLVEWRRVRQHALQHRRRDAQHAHPALLDALADPRDLIV
jgi:hypothetical protein